MDKKKIEALSVDMQKAIAVVMAAHGFKGAMVDLSAMSTGELVLKIKPVMEIMTTAISPNAKQRYQQYGPQLGLPAPGTKVAIGPLLLTMLGLSTDKQRVKALCATGNVHEIPVPVVVALSAVSAANTVAAMEEQEESTGDKVDPVTAEALAKIMGGGK